MTRFHICTCLQCGHEWPSRVADPRVCPSRKCPNPTHWARPRNRPYRRPKPVVWKHGGEALTVAEWARRLGVDANLLRQRRRRGWDVERCLTTPAEGKP